MSAGGRLGAAAGAARGMALWKGLPEHRAAANVIQGPIAAPIHSHSHSPPHAAPQHHTAQPTPPTLACWASLAGVPSSYSTPPSFSILGIAMAPPGKYGL